ncbi:MAG: DNA polymerase III subunit alpha, partial [Nanoarchaeota archaeon]|nr:DNA polymerase III subunit alpha [Nanoarchaeota archaeon]
RLVVMTGCVGGIINKILLKESEEKAEEMVVYLKKNLDDNFYIELMPNRLKEQKQCNKFLVKMIKKHKLKFVITTDSHYPNKEQVDVHRAVKAVAWRKTYEESGFDDDTFYLLQEDEIKGLIKENHPCITDEIVAKAFRYSNEIADSCNFAIQPILEDTLPKLYDNPKEKLKELTINGLEEFTPYSYNNKDIKDRIDMEIGRFLDKQYENYFLIVHDFVKWCKSNGIMVGPGRGSVGGSLAAFALNITEVDPLKFKLLFDRFISEVRKDAPDIDLDFEDIKRNKLLKYFKDKYGEKNTSKIMTYSTWHAKGALRDIGRIFKIPTAEINKICNVVVERSGGDARTDFCLMDTFTEFEQAKEFYERHKVPCDIAIQLESHIRHRGIHAAGIIISEKEIAKHVPIEKIKGEIATAWDKKEVENIGLIKFDILGLKTLSVLSTALEFVKERTGKDVVLPKEYEDKEVYKSVFTKGKTMGVFQFSTTGLSKLCKQIGANKFSDLYDATALYRPGPLHSGLTADYILRHRGKKEITYDHPLLEPITKATKGIIIYQEQVMRIMFDVGKFSWATAEASRKIMTKSKGKDAFNKMRGEFVENAFKEHGILQEESEKLFDAVSTFGSYGFNLSHSVEYSIISYWCAWMKHYYPSEFYAALLSRESDGNKIADYIRDAKEFAGIKVSHPDINNSKIGFHFDVDNLVSGFDGIKGIAEKTANKIISGQPYEDMADVIKKKKVSVSVMKGLACSGAFDKFCSNRRYIFDNADALKKKGYVPPTDASATWTEKERELKMMDYLDLPSETPLIDMFDNPFKDKIKFEKIGDLEFEEYIDERWLKGVVTFINFKQEGLEGQWTMFDNILERRYAHLNISDGTGNVLVHLSPEQYTYYKKYLEKGTGFPVIIKGHSIKDFNKIYCDAMIVLNDIDYKNPIIKYINKEIEQVIETARENNPGYNVGMIEAVTYKVSKNKNAYARLKISGASDRFLMCFRLDSDIFISGEVLVYSKEAPFIKIIERIK